MDKTITSPCNDEVALEKALSQSDVAALIVEAPGAHTGSLCIKPNFYPFMKQCAEKHGTLLLFDETISAFRFTPGGVQSWRGVEADLTVLGKSLSCGVGGGVVGGRRDVMDMLDIRPEDAEWQRHKRVFHCGSWNASPLQSAAGVAALKMYASGEPQKTADRVAERIRKGFNQVMQDVGVEGCCFGQFSTFHLYFGPCKERATCDMHLCFNTRKTPRQKVTRPLLMNFWLEGVHIIGRAELFGSTSSAHTEDDANQTIAALDASLAMLIAEGIFH
jgi:glutamate-1-semialdehyde 2,1-aminomutase